MKRNIFATDNMDLCNGSMLDKIILYTLPIVLSNLLQMLYNAADIVVVGQFSGENAVSSIGATSSLIGLLVNIFIGISVGSAIRTSYYIGACSDRDVSEVAHTSIACGAVFGAIGMVAGMLLARPALVMLNTHESLLPDALTYMYIYMCGMIFSSIYNFGAAVLRAGGDTQRPMIYLFVSGLLNVGLNFLLTGLFGLGVIGVAVGTVASQLLSAVLVVIRLTRTQGSIHVDLKKVRIHKGKLLEILRAGIPAGMQSAMFSLSNLFVTSSINACDVAVGADNMLIAGYTASGSIESIFVCCLNSFGTTVTTFAGQNYGAGKLDRVDRVPKLVGVTCIVIWIVLIAVAVPSAPYLLRISLKDSRAIEYGTMKLRVIVVGCILNIMSDIFVSQSRALGNSLTPMLVSILAVCAFRVLYLKTVYPEVQTYLSILLVYPISYAVNTALQVILYVRYRKRVGREMAARQALVSET